MGIFTDLIKSLSGNDSKKNKSSDKKNNSNVKKSNSIVNKSSSNANSNSSNVNKNTASTHLTQVNNNVKSNVSVSPTPKIDVSQLINDKRKYTDLKTNIEYIIKYLNSAIENLETPSSKIKDLYNIDSLSIDNGRINAIRQDLIEKRNYLNNVVLIELDQNVKKINESIG